MINISKNIILYHDDPNGLNHREILERPCSGTLFAMLQLAKILKEKNNNVTIISRAPDSVIEGIKYIDSSRFSLKDIYERDKYDAVIFVGRAIKDVDEIIPLKKGKIIYWHHNYLPIIDIIKKYKLRLIDHIVCVSPHHLGSIFRYGLIPTATYIRNPIDLSLFQPRNYKHRSGFAFVGNLSKDKGFDSIIRIFSKYVERGGEQNLHVYGSSSLYEIEPNKKLLVDFDQEVHEKIESLICENRIIFHGKVCRSRLYDEFEKRALLLVGLQKAGGAESAGIGAIEAQLMGMDVLTIDRGGQRDSIYDRRFVLPIGSDSVIIERLLKYKYFEKNEIDRASRETWFRKRFYYELRGRDWLNLIEDKRPSKIKLIEAVFERVRQWAHNKLVKMIRI